MNKGKAPSPPLQPYIRRRPDEEDTEEKNHGINRFFQLTTLKHLKGQHSKTYWEAVSYVVIAVVAILGAVAAIIVAIGSALLTKSYDSQAIGRFIGAIVLVLNASITVIVILTSFASVHLKNRKGFQATAAILLILTIIELIIVGLGVTIKKSDEVHIRKLLEDTFILSSQKLDPSSLKLWDATQSQLTCCGLKGPEDYRDPHTPGMPARVAFSCCTTYDTSRSEYYEKWQRDLCIINKSYHKEGCSGIVVGVFTKMAQITLGITAFLVVMRVSLAALALHLGNQAKISQDKKGLSPINEEIELSLP